VCEEYNLMHNRGAGLWAQATAHLRQQVVQRQRQRQRQVVKASVYQKRPNVCQKGHNKACIPAHAQDPAAEVSLLGAQYCGGAAFA
jgi:hypothetical protein